PPPRNPISRGDGRRSADGRPPGEHSRSGGDGGAPRRHSPLRGLLVLARGGRKASGGLPRAPPGLRAGAPRSAAALGDRRLEAADLAAPPRHGRLLRGPPAAPLDSRRPKGPAFEPKTVSHAHDRGYRHPPPRSLIVIEQHTHRWSIPCRGLSAWRNGRNHGTASPRSSGARGGGRPRP